jgi:hypothetical protein
MATHGRDDVMTAVDAGSGTAVQRIGKADETGIQEARKPEEHPNASLVFFVRFSSSPSCNIF